jgi:hypothetical protein
MTTPDDYQARRRAEALGYRRDETKRSLQSRTRTARRVSHTSATISRACSSSFGA